MNRSQCYRSLNNSFLESNVANRGFRLIHPISGCRIFGINPSILPCPGSIVLTLFRLWKETKARNSSPRYGSHKNFLFPLVSNHSLYPQSRFRHGACTAQSGRHARGGGYKDCSILIFLNDHLFYLKDNLIQDACS